LTTRPGSPGPRTAGRRCPVPRLSQAGCSVTTRSKVPLISGSLRDLDRRDCAGPLQHAAIVADFSRWPRFSAQIVVEAFGAAREAVFRVSGRMGRCRPGMSSQPLGQREDRRLHGIGHGERPRTPPARRPGAAQLLPAPAFVERMSVSRLGVAGQRGPLLATAPTGTPHGAGGRSPGPATPGVPRSPTGPPSASPSRP
jgi:hypothetical protein